MGIGEGEGEGAAASGQWQVSGLSSFSVRPTPFKVRRISESVLLLSCDLPAAREGRIIVP